MLSGLLGLPFLFLFPVFFFYPFLYFLFSFGLKWFIPRLPVNFLWRFSSTDRDCADSFKRPLRILQDSLKILVPIENVFTKMYLTLSPTHEKASPTTKIKQNKIIIKDTKESSLLLGFLAFLTFRCLSCWLGWSSLRHFDDRQQWVHREIKLRRARSFSPMASRQQAHHHAIRFANPNQRRHLFANESIRLLSPPVFQVKLWIL